MGRRLRRSPTISSRRARRRPARPPLASVGALDWSAALGDGAGHARPRPPPPTTPRRASPRSVGRRRRPDGDRKDDDDLTRDHVPVTRHSSRARRALPARRATPRPSLGLRSRGGGRLTAVGVAVVGGWRPCLRRSDRCGAIAPRVGGDADATRPAATVRAAPPTRPAADVDADGCSRPWSSTGQPIDAGVAHWTLGEPGDLVTVGDWDCDGEASAALLRPASGDVFLFATWAELDQPVTVAAVDQVVGGAAIRAEPVGEGEPSCDRLVVDRWRAGAAPPSTQ